MGQKLDELATEMFRKFARFEYALKVSGFHHGDGAAQPNWRAFSDSIAREFDATTEERFVKAMAYIIQHPPKKQMIQNGQLVWSNVDPDGSCQADLLLLYVRRVRNNLFHGGKFNGRWFEPERSEELLNSSLTILETCLTLSAKVRCAYDS
jgi:hypothetical protein